MFTNILHEPVQLKPYFSAQAGHLLQRLLENNVPATQPIRRLNSVQECKEHPFFAEIDWELLARKEVTPPYRPREGLRNFDTVDQSMSPQVFLNSQEKDALVFDQFTYAENVLK